MQTTEYKVTLLGEKNIGKTSLVKKLCGNYNENATYIPTIGVEVTPIDIHGNQGKIRVNIMQSFHSVLPLFISLFHDKL